MRQYIKAFKIQNQARHVASYLHEQVALLSSENVGLSYNRQSEYLTIFPAQHDRRCSGTLPLFEDARVLVCFDHVACRIANANHSIM
jgi:hypothetical protein